jgi:hypothetical protein
MLDTNIPKWLILIIIGIHSFKNRRNQIQKQISEEQIILNRAIQIVPSNVPLIEIESIKYKTFHLRDDNEDNVRH